MSVIHPSIATARWRKDAILFFTEDDENSSSPFFGTGQNETSWSEEKVKGGEGAFFPLLPPFPPPAEQNRFVSPFPIHSSFGTKVPLLPSPSFHVWHFKLNPQKRARGGGDSSLEVVIGLVMLMKTTTSSGIAGMGRGRMRRWPNGTRGKEAKRKKWVRGLLLLPLLVP